MSRVIAKDTLNDVDKNGSSAEIIAGPGTGEVLKLDHGASTVILPARLCGESG
ncbi:MAG: hypothetical protein LC721_01200 [Actinobacteria bacterium]|nr:hypothetical protein [Actinomycetota bacterium]